MTDDIWKGAPEDAEYFCRDSGGFYRRAAHGAEFWSGPRLEWAGSALSSGDLTHANGFVQRQFEPEGDDDASIVVCGLCMQEVDDSGEPIGNVSDGAPVYAAMLCCAACARKLREESPVVLEKAND